MGLLICLAGSAKQASLKAAPALPKRGKPSGFAPPAAAELTAMINAELSKHQVCVYTSVEGIRPVADDRIDNNWTCKFLQRSGTHRRRIVSRYLLRWCMSSSKSMISLPKSDLLDLMGFSHAPGTRHRSDPRLV
jgi:hypothetical protein